MIDDKPSRDIHHLDTSGLKCPEPVMLLHGAVRDAKPGDLIIVKATDPSTEKDFPKFCQFLGHELRNCNIEDGVYTFEIVKSQV